MKRNRRQEGIALFWGFEMVHAVFAIAFYGVSPLG
jgi:hypothetical protein